MFLINGCEQSCLPANDRAIKFGDGIFTTACVIDGHICLQNAHIQRLQEGCERLFIPFTQWDILQTEMCALVKNLDYGVLKVIISRGGGGKGYSTKGCLQPSRILSISPYPQHYNVWKKSGITLILNPVRLGRNPMLAGIKHLNRLEQVLISAYTENSGADESIVLDSEGMVIECCTANLFWRKGNDVFTPLLNQAGVRGVMRQFCLAQLARSPFHIVEINTTIQALWDADEVLVCNALMPVVPVSACENVVWTSHELYKFLIPLCERAR